MFVCQLVFPVCVITVTWLADAIVAKSTEPGFEFPDQTGAGIFLRMTNGGLISQMLSNLIQIYVYDCAWWERCSPRLRRTVCHGTADGTHGSRPPPFIYHLCFIPLLGGRVSVLVNVVWYKAEASTFTLGGAPPIRPSTRPIHDGGNTNKPTYLYRVTRARGICNGSGGPTFFGILVGRDGQHLGMHFLDKVEAGGKQRVSRFVTHGKYVISWMIIDGDNVN